MKKRGVSRCAALLLVLLMMMSTAIMLPSQDATAQTNEITGKVKTSDPVGPLVGALVSLADVHGLDPSQLTGSDGTYGFSVAAGFYELEVSMDGYFSQTYGPFRFDGDADLPIPDFNLTPTPPKDWKVSGTVLSSVTTQVTREEVDFITQTITKENVTSTLVGNTVNLDSPRIVYNSYTGYWNHPSNGTDNVMVEGSDYTLDLWTGAATITNGWMAANLTGGNGWIEFTYDHSDNTSYLENPYIAAVYQAYKNSTPWPPAGNYVLDVENGFVDVQGNFIFGLDVLEFDYEYYTPIEGATLTLYNVTKDHDVDTTDVPTGTDGLFSLESWTGVSELQTEADGYQPKATTMMVNGDQSTWILLDPAILINGWVTDDVSSSAVDNVRAYMLCKDSVPDSIKLLEADVPGSGSYYWFNAYPGIFRLIVDADGYEAQILDINVTTDAVYDFSLSLATEEMIDTTIGFVADDWNNITIYKNLTLNLDSHLPSLGTDSLGSLELEIDLTVGNGNGALDQTEKDLFIAWLVDRGPQFLTTAGLFTTEAIDYTLELLGMASRYTVAVTYDAQNIRIETVAWYTTTDITLDEDTYDLELKTAFDQTILIEGEDKVLTNYTYNVVLPSGYELIWNSSMNTEVIGFTDIFVDPKKGVGTGAVVMTVAKSDVGVAIAEVTGPREGEGDLYVYIFPGRTQEDYVAIVPAETDIQFSAANSTDPNGPAGGKISEYADFAWDFGDGNVGSGISPTHNYSDPGTGTANYTVTLTITEPGGNVTNTEINVRVDARVPKALVSYDEDDWENIGGKMHIEEDIDFNFAADLSTDEMWTGEDGNITMYAWDFNAVVNGQITDSVTQSVDTDFYTEPGVYTLNLTVWDWVGHKSDNYSKTIYVDDVTPPDVSLTILNSTFVETNFPLEQETVYFNANDSEDNFSSKENLTYSWTIDGTPKSGVNVSHSCSEPGEIQVNLTVMDEAMNEGYHNITLVCSPDPKLHSHIYMVRESFEYRPGSPEVGQSIKIKVVVANTDAGVDATNVSVRFWIVEETDKEISGTVKYYDYNGTQIFTSTIPTGGNLTAEISWTPSSHGDYTIKANCTASNELAAEEGDNSIQGTIPVIEAQWVTTMIIVVFVVLIFVIAIILLFRRKFAGRFPKLLSRKEKPAKDKKKKKVKK
ncbi:MAG: PKD domain-containing protein [Thermoplasmata archaeon]|nr:PKD domain-containing protein [Thermoplasmata archaeon]